MYVLRLNLNNEIINTYLMWCFHGVSLLARIIHPIIASINVSIPVYSFINPFPNTDSHPLIQKSCKCGFNSQKRDYGHSLQCYARCLTEPYNLHVGRLKSDMLFVDCCLVCHYGPSQLQCSQRRSILDILPAGETAKKGRGTFHFIHLPYNNKTGNEARDYNENRAK